MSIISQLNTANTFSQWLTGTQDLISKVNELVEGGNDFTFYSNTNFAVANNLTIGGNLTVSGNIVLDAIGFDDINANGSITALENLNIGGSASITSLTQTGSLLVGSLATIGGDTNITGTLSVSNTSTPLLFTQTANVSSLVGTANTLIFSSMVAANNAILSRILEAEATALAFSIALG